MKKIILGLLLMTSSMVYADNLTDYEEQCDAGESVGCFNLGAMYGNKKEYFKAKKFFGKACDLGDANACDNLGRFYGKGWGVRQSDDKAMEYYGKACDLGREASCQMIRKIQVMLSENKRVKTKQNALVDACNSGNAKECYKLAKSFLNPKKGAKKYSDAVVYYGKACEAGYALGCYDLGYMYKRGRHVKQDYAVEKKYFQKACNLKYGDGCFEVGRASRPKGRNRKNADWSIHKKFIYKSCEMGSGKGCLWIANWFRDGNPFTKKDLSEAKEYYGRSCDNGFEEGCKNYTFLNRKGK